MAAGAWEHAPYSDHMLNPFEGRNPLEPNGAWEGGHLVLTLVPHLKERPGLVRKGGADVIKPVIVIGDHLQGDGVSQFCNLFGSLFALRPNLPLPPPIAAIFKTMDKLLVQGVLGGLGRESSIAAYRANNAKVRTTIPSGRLLVITPADGWAPLCKFLGVAVPDTPFPKSNARDEFWAHFGGEPVDAVA